MLNSIPQGPAAAQRAGPRLRPGSPEKKALKRTLETMAKAPVEIPLLIGGERRNGTRQRGRALAARAQEGDRQGARRPAPTTCSAAIARGARRAARRGRATPMHERLAIFLRAAELLATQVPARSSTRRRCSGSRRRRIRRRSTPPASRSTSGAGTRTSPSASPPSSRTRRRACGTSSRRAPLEGFVFAVTPFNFTVDRRQPADGAGDDGLHRGVEAGAHGDAVGALRSWRSCARPGCPTASSTSCPGRRGDRRRGAARIRDLAGVHFTGSTGVFQTHVEDGRREHRQLPHLPAARRRDRRQGLHPRPSVGRSRRRWRSPSCAAASSTRGRSARRRRASTCPSRCGRAGCATACSAMIGELRVGDVGRLPQLHGRGDRRQVVRRTSAATSQAAKDGAGDEDARRRRAATTSEGWFVEPDAGARARTRSRKLMSRGDLRPGGDACTSIPTASGRRRCSSSTRPRPTRSPARCSRAIARAIDEARTRAAPRGRQLLHQRQADRRRGRAAAVRRRARLGHQRQGGQPVEPDPLGLAADDQGDLRAADRLPLSVHAGAVGARVSLSACRGRSVPSCPTA